VNSGGWKQERDTGAKLGERIISYLIGEYIKIRYRITLISQIEGSGGSLLNQLLDGHPELHAHPPELMIGHPEKHIWPRIDLNDSRKHLFEILFEETVNEYNREGYKRGIEDNETFLFIFIASLQREIFLNYLDSIQLITLRDVFNAYMTSYFGAWLSNQNYNGQKKFVTAFSPRLGMIKENMESFFEVYPDGRLISVVRDPKSWFPSAQKRWPGSYTDVGPALSEWNKSTQAMLWNRERYGDRVCLIQFEDLVGKTEAVMCFMAEFLGIEFDDILLTPTFNKFSVKADTSFKVKDQGTLNSLLSTEQTLTEHEFDRIEKETSETYSLLLREAVRFE
jgi:hypothetical protein